MASASDAEDELRRANLRLCRLCIWPNYDGFGCELETSARPPHLIRLVKSNSPAAACGLKIRDVVLAVNQQDVSNASYNQVRNAIKAARDSKSYVELLVVEQHFYRELKKKKVRIDSTSATILDTPPKIPHDYLNFPKNQPRICVIHLNKSDSGFGFDVVNGENDAGAYIQEVLPNTPASRTSLRKSDRIIEIDDKFVDKDVSQSIIEKLDIAKVKGAVKLYVFDTDTYKYYQTNKLPLAAKKEPKTQSEDDLSINQPRTYEYEPDEIDIEWTDQTDDEYSDQTTSDIQSSSSTINVCKGDLITQHSDVIVVCSSSQYLFNSICEAGGDTVSASYNAEIKKKSKDSIIDVQAAGQLVSKRIYFLPWTANSDQSILQKSIEQFVSDAIEKAVEERYRSIAFPAIGCGKFGCSISLVAQTMVREAHRKRGMYNISISCVIQPERTDIYDEFQKEINMIQSQSSCDKWKTISAIVGKGIIEVEQGDITMQKVDVIISSSSSGFLRKSIMKAAGDEVRTAYETELKNHPNSVLVATPPGFLSCKQIFFVRWEQDSDDDILRQSLADMISIVVQNAIAHRFTSIAFPAIGCEQRGCSIRVIVKTMVLEVKKRLINQNLPWTIKFVVQSGQQDIYDEFCKQVVTTDDGLHESPIHQLPSTWERSTVQKMRFTLYPPTEEYARIASNFHQAMKEKYTQIVRIERIQNERWYMQYLAHHADFKKRLNMDTEKRLYHGCPQQAANSIIEDGFNRSFAGVNGTVYGIGVYFSSNAVYSHGYANSNENGERCMFVARVLVGKTTKGDSSMKTRPVGFDSTTDNDHIFVTYHDAQAYAEYLITYK